MNPIDFADPLTFPVPPPEGQRFKATCDISLHLLCSIGTSFDTDAHGPQRMNPIDLADPLTFPVPPQDGQHLM